MKRVRIRRLLVGAVFAAISIVLIALGLNQNTSRSHSMKLYNVNRHFTQLEKAQGEINQQLSHLYIDEEDYFVKESTDREKIEAVAELVEEYEETLEDTLELIASLEAEDQAEMQAELTAKGFSKAPDGFHQVLLDLEMKNKVTNEINKLFLTTYLQGNQADEAVVIVDHLNANILENSKKQIQGEIAKSTADKTAAYSKAVTAGLTIAEEQVEVVERVRELAGELFNEEGQIIEENPLLLDEFYVLVADIKNEKIRESYAEQVTAIEVFLVEGLENDEDGEEEDELAEELEEDEELLASAAVNEPAETVTANNNSSSSTNSNRPPNSSDSNRPSQPSTPPASESADESDTSDIADENETDSKEEGTETEGEDSGNISGSENSEETEKAQQYTVWLDVYTEDEVGIKRGDNIFDSKEEAEHFINYQASLREGISPHDYGVEPYERN